MRAVRIVTAVAVVSALVAASAPDATQPVSLRLVEMLDGEHGYALTGNGITNRYPLLQTADGGHLWRDTGMYASSPVTSVAGVRLFSTTLRAGVFAIERSDDAGATWHRSLRFRDTHGAPAIAQPFAIDKLHLYVAVGEGAAAGSSGEALFMSDDGGHRWRFVTRTQFSTTNPHLLPFGCDKNGFGFATRDRGWAGAYCAGGRPFFYRTDDGGRTWRQQTLPAPQQCACETSAPRFSSPRDGVLYVDGFTTNGGGKPFARVLWTSDGGDHWRGSGPAVGRTSRAAIVDPRTVWITGQVPGNLRAPIDRLFRTTDSGASWQATKLHFDASSYLLDPISGTTAFAVNENYGATSMLVTRDGGRRWTSVTTLLAR